MRVTVFEYNVVFESVFVGVRKCFNPRGLKVRRLSKVYGQVILELAYNKLGRECM